MAPRKRFLLGTGQRIDAVTFGTSTLPAGDVKATVLAVLKCGYRQIDVARNDTTEREVGEAIRESGIPREEVFVIAKLPQTHHRPEDVELAINESLERLGIDYVDLYLMDFLPLPSASPNNQTFHHPDPPTPQIDPSLTWHALESLLPAKKTLAIGLSNPTLPQTRLILETCSIVPALAQIELHPYLPQNDLVAFSQAHRIHVQSMDPLSGGRVLQSEELARLAAQFAVPATQIVFAWAMYRGLSVAFETQDPGKMKEGFGAGAVRLGEVLYGLADEMVEEER